MHAMCRVGPSIEAHPSHTHIYTHMDYCALCEYAHGQTRTKLCQMYNLIRTANTLLSVSEFTLLADSRACMSAHSIQIATASYNNSIIWAWRWPPHCRRRSRRRRRHHIMRTPGINCMGWHTTIDPTQKSKTTENCFTQTQTIWTPSIDAYEKSSSNITDTEK